MFTRKAGFYWIRLLLEDFVTVGEWDTWRHFWEVPGSSEMYPDTCVAVLSKERLIEPMGDGEEAYHA